MKIILHKIKIRKFIHNKKSLGFVPTMGGLHKVHMSLIKRSIKECDMTVVSIFVNKQQFNRKTDYNKYPRFLNRDIRFFTNQYSHNLVFPVLVGAAFGFGWTPCIGPILGSILALAAIEENISKGILLLSFYSLGLAIPFIISGILIDKFLFFSKSFRKYISTITKVGGAILLLTGIAILTGQLQVLGFFILEYFPSLGNIG